jgi:hypothetical protein
MTIGFYSFWVIFPTWKIKNNYHTFDRLSIYLEIIYILAPDKVSLFRHLSIAIL